MANFGFARLAVVAPYEPNWREAKSAVGASDLLQNAKCAERLEEAVAGCTLVVGTGSLEHRKPEQPVIPLPELAPLAPKQVFLLLHNGAFVLESLPAAIYCFLHCPDDVEQMLLPEYMQRMEQLRLPLRASAPVTIADEDAGLI